MSQSLVPRQADVPAEPQAVSMQIGVIALRRWWKIAAPLGFICAAVAGAGVYFFDKPRYTASVWIEIPEHADSLLPERFGANRGESRRFVASQLEIIKSPMVLESVASMPAVAATPELKQSPDIVGALRKQLKISGKGQSDLFVIEFSSVDPERAKIVVNAVSESYLKVQKYNEQEQNEKVLATLADQQRQHQATVKNNQDVYKAKAIKVLGKDPTIGNAKEGLVVPRSPFSEIESRLVKTEVDAAILKAQAQAKKAMLQQASFSAPQLQVEQAIDQNNQVVELRARIAAGRVNLREHERNSVDLTKNRLYQDAKARLLDDEARLTKLVEQLKEQYGEEISVFAKQAAQDEVARLEGELAMTELTIQLLKEKYELKTTEEKQFTGDTLQLEFARSEFERSKQVLESINSEILNRTLSRGNPARVKERLAATTPTAPDVALAYKKIGAAAGGALLLPFGLALVIELLYRRVDNRQQLESSALTVVGEITELPRRSRSRDGAVDRQTQLFEESINGLRTYLTLADSLRDMRVLAVTSAVSREGKTSLASQLAVSIANATGESTLLIDGDMRSPDIHRIFEVDCKPGLAEVLRGESPLELAIETTANSGVHLLTAGMLTRSPHHVLGKGEFKQLLLKLREKYQHIVIDTPPILPASEALIMARAADAAVLCVRRDYSRMDQIAEAHQRLLNAGVKTVGAVLSGIPTSHYAYKYGGYYYSSSANEAEANSAQISV